MKKENYITYAEAIREAIDLMMERDKSVFVIGEGVPDPKGIFGTTIGLKEKYGEKRVFDMPLSENALTGICIGASMNGLKPILIHQRIDFSLYSLDQIINNSAKWSYMFAGKSNIPIVIRMIVGRGWGQGSQHSQNLQSLFAHIPGLKVVMPSTPQDAKGLLISSIEDKNPVIFIEHRWLHNMKGLVEEGYYKIPLSETKIVQEGSEVTIVSTSYMNLESERASKILEKIGIKPELIDVRTLSPLDESQIVNSVNKTGNLIVCDLSCKSGGFANEIITRVVESSFDKLKSSPIRITCPDHPTPTTPALANHYYPISIDIVRSVLEILNRPAKDFLNAGRIYLNKYGKKSLDQADVPSKGAF